MFGVGEEAVDGSAPQLVFLGYRPILPSEVVTWPTGLSHQNPLMAIGSSGTHRDIRRYGKRQRKFDTEVKRYDLNGKLPYWRVVATRLAFSPDRGHGGIGSDGAKMDGVYLADLNIGQTGSVDSTEMRLRRSPIIVENVGQLQQSRPQFDGQ